jgi:CRP/FNR family cyclic AMP-dependent transcriptional regulator
MSEPPIRLLEAEPDLMRFLTAQQRQEARGVHFPVRLIARGEFDLDQLLAETDAFGAMLLDGMLLHHLQLGGRGGARLLGGGDFLSRTDRSRSILIGESGYRAVTPTRLALLGHDLLLATRRWPQLLAGLQARVAEQTDRIIAQLMICQLPRVEDRVLSMLWLLAEPWGTVGPAGTVLPLALTHEMLGGLIGAQRSTVTLALRELSDRGAVLRQETGFLLMLPPPLADGSARVDEPRLLRRPPATWRGVDRSGEENQLEPQHVAMQSSLAELREQHLRSMVASRRFLHQMEETRERTRELRARVSETISSRRRAPSS